MTVKVVLVDINPTMVAGWRKVSEDNREVDIVQGSLIDQTVDAWVTPTNARAVMEGGLDGLIKQKLGPGIQTRVQSEVARRYHGAISARARDLCGDGGGDAAVPHLHADDGQHPRRRALPSDVANVNCGYFTA